MISYIQNNTQAVIRHANERTLNKCKEIASELFGSGNIAIVNEVPFSQALRKSFEVGIDSGKEWTICIDADVLLVPDLLKLYNEEFQKVRTNTFEIHSWMLDKFFGGIKPGGIKFYRSSLLKEAIGYIPKPEESMRPESMVIKSMRNKGYVVQDAEIVAGIHDFGQFYKDLFRKAFLHAKKHKSHAVILEPYWKRQAEVDIDFQIILEGYYNGTKTDVNSDLLNVNFYNDLTSRALEKCNIHEKGVFGSLEFTNIREYVDSFVSPPEYFQSLELMKDQQVSAPKKTNHRNIFKRFIHSFSGAQ